MELFSQSFIRAVRQTLDSSSCTILGTIPIPKGKPLGLVEEVRSRRDVKIFTVSTITSTLSGEKRKIFRSVQELLSPYNSYRTVFTLYPLGLRRAVSLPTNAEGACPALSRSYSRINSKSCVTDSTTKGGLKCQNNLSRKTQLWILSCKILTMLEELLYQARLCGSVNIFWQTYDLYISLIKQQVRDYRCLQHVVGNLRVDTVLSEAQLLQG